MKIETENVKNNIIKIIPIQLAIIVFSLSGVFQKIASQYETFSFGFVLFYGISILIMIVYAFVWQIILKKHSMILCYSNRATGTAWSVIWGILLFGESLSWKHIVGTIIICVGIFFIITSVEEK